MSTAELSRNVLDRYAQAIRGRQQVRTQREVAGLLSLVSEQTRQIRMLDKQIDDTQAVRDGLRRTRRRSSNKGHRRSRGSTSVLSIDEALTALRSERRALVAARAQSDECRRQLTQLTDDEYYAARHELLEAVYALECEQVQGFVERKRLLLTAAGVGIRRTDEFRVDVYRDGFTTANMYYGGFECPDGPGHGHTTLVVVDGAYVVSYNRPPSVMHQILA